MLSEALESVRGAMVFDPRDWSLINQDAWVYGILVGWGDALPEIARKHRWPPADVERLKRLRRSVENSEPRSTPPDATSGS